MNSTSPTPSSSLSSLPISAFDYDSAGVDGTGEVILVVKSEGVFRTFGEEV